MKKVLVIVDNNLIFDKIIEVLKGKNFKDVEFDFKHSPNNQHIKNHPYFTEKVDSEINVNKEIKYIVNTYDLLISAHCQQILPKELVRELRCVNIHPGYNPLNRGWYPQVFAIVYDLPVGATIHEIDEKIDHGKIIARKLVEKHIWDTSLTLYERIIEAEIELFNIHIKDIIYNSYTLIEPENEGNMFLKKDFLQLCELNLEEKGSFIDFYNRLRALSHGSFKNAYFIDKSTGKKIYLGLNITHE